MGLKQSTASGTDTSRSRGYVDAIRNSSSTRSYSSSTPPASVRQFHGLSGSGEIGRTTRALSLGNFLAASVNPDFSANISTSASSAAMNNTSQTNSSDDDYSTDDGDEPFGALPNTAMSFPAQLAFYHGKLFVLM